MIKLSIIRKENGKYKLYSRKKNPKTGKRRLLGESDTLEGIKKREKQIQFFKHYANDQDTQDNETKVLHRISETGQYLENAGMIEKANEIYAAMDSFDCFDNYIDNQINTENQGSLSNEGFSQGTFNAPEAERLANLANKLDKMGYFKEADQIDNILTSIANDELDEESEEDYLMPTSAQIKEYENDVKLFKKVKKLKQFYEEGSLDDLIKANNVEGFIVQFLRMNQNNEQSAGFINGIMVAMEAISPSEAGGDQEHYQAALRIWQDPNNTPLIEDYMAMDNVDMLAHSNGLQTSTSDATNNFNGLSDFYFYTSYNNLDNRYKIAP